MPLAPELVWLEEQLFEESQVPVRVLSQFHPLVRVGVIGFTLADIAAGELATRTIEAGGAGAMNLFTPEIRRYESTALVGMGGMII